MLQIQTDSRTNARTRAKGSLDISAKRGPTPDEEEELVIRPIPSEYSGVVPEPRTRAELFSQYEDILEVCRRTGDAVHITEDGEDELIVMSPKAYRRLRLAELIALCEEANADEAEGRFTPLDEVFAELEEDMRNGTL